MTTTTQGAKRVGIVFDIETIRHPQLETWLGTDEKIARLDDVTPEGLSKIAAVNDIKIGNLKDPAKIKDKIVRAYRAELDDAAVKQYGCSICTIAAKDVHDVDYDHSVIRRGKELPEADNYKPPHVWTVTDEHSERDVIMAFLEWLAELDAEPVLMGFNVRGTKSWKQGFDVPILRVRCAMLGIPWPRWLPKNLGDDRRSHRLFDVCDVLTEGSLDQWLRMAQLPPKTAGGAEVQDMSPDERASYCANDVELERLLCGVVLPTQNQDLTELL
jgi:hypothetical protein